MVPGKALPRVLARGTALVLVLASALLRSLDGASAAELAIAEGSSLEARFRGCDAGGWCRFSVASGASGADLILRVHPVGVAWADPSSLVAVALRDRLNGLLSDMIHQVKRVELHGLRKVADDGVWAATVTVHGIDVALDPELRTLSADVNRPAR